MSLPPQKKKKKKKMQSPVKKAVQEAGGRLKKGKPAAIDIAVELQQAKQMATNMEKGMEKMELWRLEDKQSVTV